MCWTESSQLVRSPTLAIRADANQWMGTGHLMRCLAIAQRWRELVGDVALFTGSDCEQLLSRYTALGSRVERIPCGMRAGSSEDADWFSRQMREDKYIAVLDGYHFDAQFQRHVKNSGVRLAVVDDYVHADHYTADLVLNQNAHASIELYAAREPNTQLMLGSRFVVLRHEFARWRGWRRNIPDRARNVLVSLGGADQENVTARMISALREVPGLDVIVVLGPENPNRDNLEETTRGVAGIRLEENCCDIAKKMAWADCALIAGGTTAWECAFMGLPSIVCDLTANQTPVAEQMNSSKAGRHVTRNRLLSKSELSSAIRELVNDPEDRAVMSAMGQKLVDGRGVDRVIKQLTAGPLHLREATSVDCRLLWEWANQPSVRSSSFSTEPIPWSCHSEWFDAKLNDANCVLLIATNESGKAVGQVRFELDGMDAIISISIDEQFRGRGYGTQMIRVSCQWLFSNRSANRIHAYIRDENVASVRVFELAGFEHAEQTQVSGHIANRLVLDK